MSLFFLSDLPPENSAKEKLEFSRSRASPFGQRARVRGQGSAPVAGQYWRENTVHRTRLSMGERLLRIVQQQAQGRVSQRRDLLLIEGSTGPDRALAGPLQYATAAFLTGLPLTGASGYQPDSG